MITAWQLQLPFWWMLLQVKISKIASLTAKLKSTLSVRVLYKLKFWTDDSWQLTAFETDSSSPLESFEEAVLPETRNEYYHHSLGSNLKRSKAVEPPPKDQIHPTCSSPLQPEIASQQMLLHNQSPTRLYWVSWEKFQKKNCLMQINSCKFYAICLEAAPELRQCFMTLTWQKQKQQNHCS